MKEAWNSFVLHVQKYSWMCIPRRELEDVAEKLKTGQIAHTNKTLGLNRGTAKDVKPYIL